MSIQKSRSVTINIRCQSYEIYEDVFEEISELFNTIADEKPYTVDLNYDTTKNGGKIIKIEERKDVQGSNKE